MKLSVWQLRRFLLLAVWPLDLVLMPFYVLAAVVGRFRKRLSKRAEGNTKIVWGTDPITNLIYWSLAMNEAGYISRTWVTNPYSNHTIEDFDLVLGARASAELFKRVKMFSLLSSNYDIVCTSFNGFLLGHSKLAWVEPRLLHLSGKRIVAIPFGSDAHVYRRHRSIASQHALQIDYPEYARRQDELSRQVARWVKAADAVLPGLMGPNGIGRWDVFAVSSLCIDTTKWAPKSQSPVSDSGLVRIAHFPNHRGVKGTEFIMQACEQLIKEGVEIELDFFQGLSNEEALSRIRDSSDIVVESVTGPGHGLTAIESMSLGKVVINNLDDDNFFDPFRRYSFFAQCPIVSANPENIKEVIRKLALDRNLRDELSKAGREYVVRFHSLKAAQVLFSHVFEYVLGNGPRPINLFHPISGYYSGFDPIPNPLKKNRIAPDLFRPASND